MLLHIASMTQDTEKAKIYWLYSVFLASLGSALCVGGTQLYVDSVYSAFRYEVPIGLIQVLKIIGVLFMSVSPVSFFLSSCHFFGSWIKPSIILVVVLLVSATYVYNYGDFPLREYEIGRIGNMPIVENYSCLKKGPISINHLFECDFNDMRNIEAVLQYSPKNAGGEKVSFKIRLFIDNNSNSIIVSIYVPDSKFSYEIAQDFAKNHASTLEKIYSSGKLNHLIPEGFQRLKMLANSRKVHLYHENDWGIEKELDLAENYKSKGLNMELRGPRYLRNRAIHAQENNNK